MTLNDSRINNLYVYLTDEYQKKLQDLESVRIKEILESDKYKQRKEKEMKEYKVLFCDSVS